MSTKKLQAKRPLPRIHPAAVSADSDLVKLVREFEGIKAALAKQKETIQECEQKEQDAYVLLKTVQEQNVGILASITRETRVLQARSANAQELMVKALKLREIGGCDVGNIAIPPILRGTR